MKKKTIKKVLGNRLYLEMPADLKTNIHLDNATKRAIQEERMRTWGRLKVFAVGDTINDIKIGDEVMIDPTAVEKVRQIPISPTEMVLLVSYFDIAHVWEKE
jgi:hypothetical protein